VQRTQTGRGVGARPMLIRVRELESPQLFPRSPLAASSGNPLGLKSSTSTNKPRFLVDTNVLFDLHLHRLNHDNARKLLQAATAHRCKIVISDEMQRELTRTSRGAVDPMLQLISALPTIPCSRGASTKSLTDELGAMIFPERHRQGHLKPNDLSDLHHLATAIEQGVEGFVTSDTAILRCSGEVAKRFGLQLLPLEMFHSESHEPNEPQSVMTPGDSSLTQRSILPQDLPEIRTLLRRLGVASDELTGRWVPFDFTGAPACRIGIWTNDGCIGYLTWSGVSPTSDHVAIRAVVDESHPDAPSAAKLLMRTMTQASIGEPPRKLGLETPEHQSILREEAIRSGFFATREVGLEKVAAGSVVTRATWGPFREELAQVSGVRLPAIPPVFRSPTQPIEILAPDETRRFPALDALETYLSPILLCLPGRPGILAPIWKQFAEPLFDHSPQLDLMPAAAHALHLERMYLSSPRTLKHFSRGAIVLFYESGHGGGCKAVVAVARVTESFLQNRQALTGQQLERSVLRSDTLTEIGSSPVKTVTIVDNVFRLKSPVPLKRLEELGCGSSNQLITTQPLEERQLLAILTEGFRDARH
jgi:predicted nucleic acid-binding protein